MHTEHRKTKKQPQKAYMDIMTVSIRDQAVHINIR